MADELLPALTQLRASCEAAFKPAAASQNLRVKFPVRNKELHDDDQEHGLLIDLSLGRSAVYQLPFNGQVRPITSVHDERIFYAPAADSQS